MFASKRIISIVGLGYVGLPLAVLFGKKFQTIGFDVNEKRIKELCDGVDRTLEVNPEDLKETTVKFTSNLEDLKNANFHIIAVPTPINEAKQPDLIPLYLASDTVGSVLKKGDIVVYESTVYPGVTEEECLPILEKVSGLKAGVDFKVGYSPERVNPGDKERTLDKITKIVSAQDAESLKIVSETYEQIITAGVHPVSSIKVAEAAKVIENTQRDLNIALMNELAIIFEHIGIDTNEVINAAGTKWNFLKFRPGLVGGHCIGVDPYYLTHKAEKLGYHPQVILAGRRINDGMGKFIAGQAVKQMINAGHSIRGNNVTILGLTFKENCADIRNSKVVDIIAEFKEFGLNVQVHDPYVSVEDAKKYCGVKLVKMEELEPSAAVVVAVAHNSYKSLVPEDFAKMTEKNAVIIDVKNLFSQSGLEELGYRVWRL
jgi:UDP-N-acetyl-D-glucosamine/UDP-N-acetyl-D-galactosamine dehydrogenase